MHRYESCIKGKVLFMEIEYKVGGIHSLLSESRSKILFFTPPVCPHCGLFFCVLSVQPLVLPFGPAILSYHLYPGLDPFPVLKAQSSIRRNVVSRRLLEKFLAITDHSLI
jgi:hypothetical protein